MLRVEYHLECDGCGETITADDNPRKTVHGWQNGQRFTPQSTRQAKHDLCPECSVELVVTQDGIVRERLHRMAGVA